MAMSDLTQLEEEAQRWSERPAGPINPNSPLSHLVAARTLRMAAHILQDEWMQQLKTWAWCDMASSVMHVCRQLRRLASHHYVTAAELNRAHDECDDEGPVLVVPDKNSPNCDVCNPGECGCDQPEYEDPAKQPCTFKNCSKCERERELERELRRERDKLTTAWVQQEYDGAYRVEEVIATRDTPAVAVESQVTGVFADVNPYNPKARTPEDMAGLKARLVAAEREIEYQRVTAETAIHDYEREKERCEDLQLKVGRMSSDNDMALSQLMAIKDSAKGCPGCTLEGGKVKHCTACLRCIAEQTRNLFTLEAEKLGL